MIIMHYNSQVRINNNVMPWAKGNILHVQKQRCQGCNKLIGGIAIDMDYVEQGDKLLDFIVQILDTYKCKSVCQNCLAANIKNPMSDRDIRDLK